MLALCAFLHLHCVRVLWAQEPGAQGQVCVVLVNDGPIQLAQQLFVSNFIEFVCYLHVSNLFLNILIKRHKTTNSDARLLQS